MIAHTAMQPDIKLVLDPEGVIRQVVVANDMADEPVDDWLGMHWWQTVGEVDSQRVTQFLRRADLVGHDPVRPGPGDNGADRRQGSPGACRRGQRGPQVEGARSGP